MIHKCSVIGPHLHRGWQTLKLCFCYVSDRYNLEGIRFFAHLFCFYNSVFVLGKYIVQAVLTGRAIYEVQADSNVWFQASGLLYNKKRSHAKKYKELLWLLPELSPVWSWVSLDGKAVFTWYLSFLFQIRNRFKILFVSETRGAGSRGTSSSFIFFVKTFFYAKMFWQKVVANS